MTKAVAIESPFEVAADAVVSGDLGTLQRLLREDQELVYARSTRAHHATLLHYLGANGVEDSRQKSPLNAVSVAQVLLQAGAAADAVADLYGGSTTLELVATSFHPQQAGVQLALMEALIDCGADPERGSPLVNACLGNNRLPAAEFLAAKGVHLDLAAAAGLGRVDLVRESLEATPPLLATPFTENTSSPAVQGFLWACAYGHDAVLPLFLDRGMPVDAQDKFGQTGLHQAAMGCHLSTMILLLSHGASLESHNTYGGTVLGQVLWSAAHARDRDAYLPVINFLLEAGALIPQAVPPVSGEIDALLTRSGCPPDSVLSW
jgi:hypothetical protein